MIDTKNAFIRLLKDLEESSPKFSSTLNEISPIKFCINIWGYRKIYLTIDGAKSKISFNENDFDFEIEGSLIELLGVLASKKIKRVDHTNVNLMKAIDNIKQENKGEN